MAKQAERRAATTEAILKAGRRLFGERGFAATTMDDIADAARVAKGAVYHHFATKEAVFEAVFDQVSLDLVQEVDRAAANRTAFAPAAGRRDRSGGGLRRPVGRSEGGRRIQPRFQILARGAPFAVIGPLPASRSRVSAQFRIIVTNGRHWHN